MTEQHTRVTVRGPWSLDVSRRFWEGFGPNRLTGQVGAPLSATFLVDADWSRAEAVLRQTGETGDTGDTADITVTGTGDLDAAVTQVLRFCSLDVDATGWPAVGERDPVIGAAQRELPGFRPCGFYSPYEAAVWTVLSQRIRITQAAALLRTLVERHGDQGAFPSPTTLLGAELDLPGRKPEYVRAVAEAALDGLLTGTALRAVPAEQAVAAVRQVKGLGPFSADLVVIRGANAPDGLPTAERRLEAEIVERYGPDRSLAQVSENWRPFRTWAAVCLRALREERTQEVDG